MSFDANINVGVRGDFSELERHIRRIEAQGINFRPINSSPLGRLTGQVSEFDKSMAAANARVIAFGASAGIISNVVLGLSNMVKQAFEVEKVLTDINSILNASDSGIKSFGNSLFEIAKNTGTTFSEVAEAAKELARQGLSATETLKRTNDALVLTRLSGLEAAKSVEALTATVNSFTKEALTTTDIVNRLANVDAAFAVSSADLANALSRVGSTAQDAKVSFNELIAVVTAVQQRTARGGAVIGNALKTIFTRLERSDTLDQLADLGIAVRDLEGNTVPAIQILSQLARTFDDLNDSQKASVGQLVGGVYQINILKSALKDIGGEYSIYKNALNVANQTTDEASLRNEALNKSLSALANQSLANFTKLSAAAGKLVFAPSLEKIFGGFNNLSEAFGGTDAVSRAGQQIGEGLLKGIGNALSGPGLVAGGFLFAKLFGNFAKFAADSGQRVLGIGQATERQRNIQSSINDLLARNPQLYDQILSRCRSVAEQERVILEIIQSQVNAERQRAALVSNITPGLLNQGVRGTEGGGFSVRPRPATRFAGHVPNLIDQGAIAQEVLGARSQGYSIAPTDVRSMSARIDGRQTQVVYNNKERVIHNFAGTGEPAIIPPNKTILDLFKEKFSASGFVPSLAVPYGGRTSALVSPNNLLGWVRSQARFGKELPPETRSLFGEFLSRTGKKFELDVAETHRLIPRTSTGRGADFVEGDAKLAKNVGYQQRIRGLMQFDAEPNTLTPTATFIVPKDTLSARGGANENGFINSRVQQIRVPRRELETYRDAPKTRAREKAHIEKILAQNSGETLSFTVRYRGADINKGDFINSIIPPSSYESSETLTKAIKQAVQGPLSNLGGRESFARGHIPNLLGGGGLSGARLGAAATQAALSSSLAALVQAAKNGNIYAQRKLAQLQQGGLSAAAKVGPLAAQAGSATYDTALRARLLGEKAYDAVDNFKVGKVPVGKIAIASTPFLDDIAGALGLFSGGHVPNLAGLSFNRSVLGEDVFLKASRQEAKNFPQILNKPDLGVFTLDLGGHAPNAIIPANLRQLKKRLEADPELSAYLDAFGKKYFPNGIATRVAGVYGLDAEAGVRASIPTGSPGGTAFENELVRAFGVSKPSGSVRPDAKLADIEKLRAGTGGSVISSAVAQGEYKLSPFEIDKRGKIAGPSPSISQIVANSIKEDINVLSRLIPAEEFKKFVQFQPFGSEANIGQILGKKYGLNFAHGHVPNLAQISAQQAIAYGLSDQIPGLKDAITRETTGTGVGLGQTRVNFLSSGSLPPVSVTNTRDEGPSADPLIGFNRVRSQGGRIELAGSGREFSSGGHIPNLIYNPFANPLRGLSQDELRAVAQPNSGADDKTRSRAQRQLATAIEQEVQARRELTNSLRRAVASQRVLNASEQDRSRVLQEQQASLKNSGAAPLNKKEILREAAYRDDARARGVDLSRPENSYASYKAQQANRRSEIIQRAGLFGAFGVPLIGGAISQGFQSSGNFQAAATAQGVTNAAGTGLAIASLSPNKLGPLFGSLVGGFQALTSVINNLTPNFEILQRQSQELVSRQTEQVNAISTSLQADAQVKEVIVGGGTKAQVRSAQQRAEEAVLSITDLDVQRKYRAARGNTSEQETILGDAQRENFRLSAERNFIDSSAKAGDMATTFAFPFQRRNVLSLRKFFGVKTDQFAAPDGSDNPYKDFTDVQIKGLAGLALKTGAGEDATSQTINRLQKALEGVDVYADSATQSLSDISREFGLSQKIFESISKDGSAKDTAKVLSQLFELRLNATEIKESQKALEAFAFSVRKFNLQLSASALISSRLASRKELAVNREGESAFLGLESANRLDSPFLNARANAQRQRDFSLERGNFDNLRELNSIQRGARERLLSITGDNLTTNGVLNTQFRNDIANGATSSDPLAALRRIESALSAQDVSKGLTTSGQNNGVGTLQEIRNFLGESGKKEDAAAEALRAIQENTELSYKAQLATLRINRVLETLRGKEIAGENGLDVSRSIAGLAATLRLRLDADNPTKKRDERLTDRTTDAYGRSNNYRTRLQSLAEKQGSVARGIEDDLNTGFLPNGLDVTSAKDRFNKGEINFQTYSSIRNANARGQARYRGSLVTRQTALVNNELVGGVDTLQNALQGIAKEGGFGNANIEGLLRRLKASANNNDFAGLQRDVNTLEKFAPRRAKGAIADFRDTLAGARDQFTAINDRATLQTASTFGLDNSPLNNANFSKGIQQLLDALKESGRIVSGRVKNDDGSITEGNLLESSTQPSGLSGEIITSAASFGVLNEQLIESIKTLRELNDPENFKHGTSDSGGSEGRGTRPLALASGHVPESPYRKEQESIKRGVGGALLTDVPLHRYVQGLGPVTVNSGEKIIENFVPGKAAILTRDMQRNWANGRIPTLFEKEAELAETLSNSFLARRKAKFSNDFFSKRVQTDDFVGSMSSYLSYAKQQALQKTIPDDLDATGVENGMNMFRVKGLDYNSLPKDAIGVGRNGYIMDGDPAPISRNQTSTGVINQLPQSSTLSTRFSPRERNPIAANKENQNMAKAVATALKTATKEIIDSTKNDKDRTRTTDTAGKIAVDGVIRVVGGNAQEVAVQFSDELNRRLSAVERNVTIIAQKGKIALPPGTTNRV